VGTYLVDGVRGDDWSLRDCLGILYRHKRLLAALTGLGILISALITALQTRVYRSTASLEIGAFNESFLDLRDIYPNAVPGADAAVYVQTQAEMLRQDNLLEQVAGKLHLESLPEYRSSRGIAARLRQDITIVPVRNSRIIQIVCDARSASLAADIANTLGETFIDESVRARQGSALKTYQTLLPQLNELRRSMRLSPGGAGGGAAARGTDADRRLYEAMTEKTYQAWLASRLPFSNIRLVDRAEPSLVPHRPNIPLNLGMGLIGGLLLAVATVMLREQHKSVLRAPGEAEAYLALPELGAIPQADNWTPSGFFFFPGSAHNRTRIEQVALEQQDGLAESFRATAASILSAGRNGSSPRLLVVTSSQPMEGKTTVVSNLGIALAAISRKVLLIDGDMRRPRLHRLFDEANSWGLSDVLREKNAIDELPIDVLAKKTSVPHLYLLPSGASTDNIFGLLCSGRMSRLLPLFREEFDYVLVDAPPCLEFADARIMGRYAEELLLVVRANWTDRRTVQAAVQRLRLDGIPLMGVILNRWDPAPGDPYAYRGVRSVIRQDIS
jgi:polysaccharide biosynthesis transport protein